MHSGQTSAYIKTADSGSKREHGFCPRCGTPIYAAPLGDEPKAYSLRLGKPRQRPEITPSVEMWTQPRLGWVDHVADIKS